MDDTTAEKVLSDLKEGLKNLTQDTGNKSTLTWPSATMNSDYSYSFSSSGIDSISIDPIDLTTVDPGVFSIQTPTNANVQIVGHGAIYTTSASPNWSAMGQLAGANGSNSKITANGTVELQGENADIVINGQSILKLLAGFEERLNWLKPNPELEQEWDELKELGDRYRELENRCKEKAKIWEKLKSMPPPPKKI